MDSDATPATPRDRVRASFQLWLANLVLACLVGRTWLAHAPLEGGWLGFLFLGLALLSTLVALSLLPHLLLTVAALLPVPGRLLAGLHALVWTGFLGLCYFDTRIYDIFRYHLNGMVWNVIATRGVGDSVELSTADWITVGAGLALGLALQAWGYGRLVAGQRARRTTERPPAWSARPARVWLTVLLPVVVAEKALYAVSDLRHERRVTAAARVLPGYLPVTVKGFLRDNFGVEIDEVPRVALGGEGLLLDYPRQPVRLPEEGPRPNVLMVVIDSLRADALEPEAAPHLSAFAQRARLFTDHLSAGNSTRFGIFALLYGLYGVYWDPFYAEQRSPVLVDALLDAGYTAAVFSTASMTSPEFTSTAWARLDPADVHDSLRRGVGKVVGDVLVGQQLNEWLGERAAEGGPWFAFALLDSPHQVYSFPPEDALFEPYLTDWNYRDLGGDPDAETRQKLVNSYRNAVHHADAVMGDVLRRLEELGLLDETLVLVTGDHGEEFGECGLWGHTSSFARPQLHVPLLLAGPGVEPGVEDGPTSHLDVAPTLLELCGADPALRASYSLGGSLLDPRPGTRVASGWGQLGLWVDEGILLVPIQSHRGGTEVYTGDWRLVLDDAPILRAHADTFLELTRACSRFLR